MSSLMQGPFGAYTNLAALAISQALAKAGLFTTGNIYYLDPKNGNDNWNGQSPVSQGGGVGPVKTLAIGYGLLSSGNNDVLVLIGDGTTNGTARLSSAFTWSKNAAHMIGICAPSLVSQRARIAPTAGVTAFANFFTVSGNGCYFSNIQFFQGFNTGTTAQICLTVSGQRNVFSNCSIDGMGDAASAQDTASRSLLVSGGENRFTGCSIGVDTVTRTVANYSVEFSGNCARNAFEDCVFPIASSSTSAAILYTAAGAAIDRYTLFKRCVFISDIQSGGFSTPDGVAKLAAASGGLFAVQDSWYVGFTNFGADATTKAQCYLATPISTNAGGKATVNT